MSSGWTGKIATFRPLVSARNAAGEFWLRANADSWSCTAPRFSGTGARRPSMTTLLTDAVATVRWKSSISRTSARTAASRLDRTRFCASRWTVLLASCTATHPTPHNNATASSAAPTGTATGCRTQEIAGELTLTPRERVISKPHWSAAQAAQPSHVVCSPTRH